MLLNLIILTQTDFFFFYFYFFLRLRVVCVYINGKHTRTRSTSYLKIQTLLCGNKSRMITILRLVVSWDFGRQARVFLILIFQNLHLFLDY